MQKGKYFIFIFFLIIVSCNQGNESAVRESTKQAPGEALKENNQLVVKPDSGIQYKIIPGENGSQGFGYDIYMNGKLYIHQPTIPAVSGNRTFDTEQKAALAAQLVVYKIEHQILPPTVEIRELDSLHLLE